jgi:hypothetical protein
MEALGLRQIRSLGLRRRRLGLAADDGPRETMTFAIVCVLIAAWIVERRANRSALEEMSIRLAEMRDQLTAIGSTIPTRSLLEHRVLDLESSLGSSERELRKDIAAVNREVRRIQVLLTQIDSSLWVLSGEPSQEGSTPIEAEDDDPG